MASPKEKCDGGDTSCKKLELNKTAGVQEDDSPPGSRTPKSPQSDGSSVSDDTCSICLGHITDKCVIKACFHNFCFVCLKEWAKQKPICPLCKVSFTTIMHDIKAINEYKEYVVPRPVPTERIQAIANFQEFLDAERRRFFGYRTTNFPGAIALRRQHPGRPQAIPDAIPSGPRERRSAARYNHRGSSIFRLSVYHNDVWVQPLADITGRYRQSGPDLYREQPALTHRLVSWVNRELAALVPSSRVGVVLVEVMELIERHPIDSREFRRAMRPHLGVHTNHFVHEFYHFSRSPYDMVGHDNAAQYVPRFGFADDTSSSSSDDSDAVVEVDVRGNPIPTSSNHQGPADLHNIEREETLTQEGSVVISSDDTSSSESSQQSNQFMKLSVESTRQSDLTMTHNPEPPPAVCNMRRLLGRARNFLNSVNEGASTSRPEEILEASLGESGHSLKREVPSDSGDSDTCIIVEEVKKKRSPPELIDLDSDEESRQTLSKKSSDQFNGGKSKDGLSSSHQKQERGEKRKLSLKRHNFPIAGTSSGSGSSSGRKALKEDHSYCSEQKPVKFEASTSASNSSKSMQTSSLQISLKWHNHIDNNGSVVFVRKKDNVNESKRSRSSSSDSESSSHNVHLKKHKHRNKVKHKHSSSKSKSSDRARDNTHDTSSQYKGKSPMQSSSAGAKKDHRSKVKSSSRHSTLHVSHDRQGHDRVSHEIQSYDRLTRVHCYSSETSSNTVGTSDNHWTPLSTSWTERSSSRDEWYPENNHNRDSSFDSRSSLHRERRGEGSGTSKSRHSCKKRKHKSKKSKKSKHKKKSKPKKIIYSDSSSDTDSSYSTCKKSKKKTKLVESSTSDTDTTLDLKPRRKTKKNKKLSDSSSCS